MSSIEISNRDFKALAQLIYQEAGINIHSGKMALLKSKIAKRMRSTGISTCPRYLEYLRENKDEVVEFIDAVTTNHSFFFRENASISVMIQRLASQANRVSKISNNGHVRPPDTTMHESLKTSNHKDFHIKRFKIWCAACSTGDEPYSVAVQLMDLGINFDILATDISHSVLDKATRGVYGNDRVKHVPIPLLHRYFQKGKGKQQGYVRVKKEVKTHVTFKKFNLVTDIVPDEQFDVILCRNVMIYFDNTITEKVINRLYRALVPGGLFIIGQSESLMNLTHRFKAIREVPSTFQK